MARIDELNQPLSTLWFFTNFYGTSPFSIGGSPFLIGKSPFLISK